MLEHYLEIFEQTATLLVEYIPAVVVLWVLFTLISNLIFGRS